MDVAFDSSISGRMQGWIEDAINRITYPLSSFSHDVTFELVAEPPCTGHADYMCTQTASGASTIYIRAGADDAGSTINAWLPAGTDIKAFFQESIAHEVAHAMTFDKIDNDPDRTDMAALFVLNRDGDRRTGLLADWNDLAKPWADRVQEAVAEVWKDMFFPESQREFDNRTNWVLPRSNLDAFVDYFAPPGGTSIIQTIIPASSVATLTGQQWTEPGLPDLSLASYCTAGSGERLVPSTRRTLYRVPETVFDDISVADGIIGYGLRASEWSGGCLKHPEAPLPRAIVGPDAQISYIDMVAHIDWDFAKHITDPDVWGGFTVEVTFECEMNKNSSWARGLLENFNTVPAEGGFDLGYGAGGVRILNRFSEGSSGQDRHWLHFPQTWGFLGVAHDSAFTDWAGRDVSWSSEPPTDPVTINWKQGEPDDALLQNVVDLGNIPNKYPRYLRAAPNPANSIIGRVLTIGGSGLDKEMENDYSANGVHIWYRFVQGPIYLYRYSTDALEVVNFTLSNPTGSVKIREFYTAPPMEVTYPYEGELSAGQGPTGVQRLGR